MTLFEELASSALHFLAKTATQEFRDNLDRAEAVENRHHADGFIARNAYDIQRDCFRTCISCGSKTQPCCGH
jgi:hypothetical protein